MRCWIIRAQAHCAKFFFFLLFFLEINWLWDDLMVSETHKTWQMRQSWWKFRCWCPWAAALVTIFTCIYKIWHTYVSYQDLPKSLLRPWAEPNRKSAILDWTAIFVFVRDFIWSSWIDMFGIKIYQSILFLIYLLAMAWQPIWAFCHEKWNAL